jgi:cell wall-associated NlpC family hydrolase
MRILTLAFAVVLSMLGSAEADNKTHTVRSGETLSHIAHKYGVAQSAILRVNRLSDAHKLQLGQKLTIPLASASLNSRSAGSVAKNSARNQPGTYLVRNGDHDWSIARKVGVTVATLHQLNPKVNWRKLQIGQSLRVPSKKGVSLVSLVTPPKLAAKGAYKVRMGDNDWIIARRVGTTPSKLRAVNPGVKWTSLQIGQVLRVPGGQAPSATAKPTLAVNKINTRHAQIARDNVVIRRSPSTSAGKVTMVSAGTYVTVLDRESGWYKLKFPRGTVGWVRGDMLKPLATKYVARSTTRSQRVRYAAAPSPKPKVTFSKPTSSLALLDTAYSMLGVRYRYGAASRSATDCSGFTSQVYKSHGVKIPRTSREQATIGQKVAKDELKAGDLVFFKTRRSSRISHVGIYVGNGKFIHASSGKGSVRTDSLNSGYYANRYAGARRVKKNLKPSEKEAIAKKEKEDAEKEVAEKVAAKTEAEPALVEPKDPAPKSSGTDDIIR